MASQLFRAARSKHHLSSLIRCFSTNKPSHHIEHAQNQEYLQPNPIIGSWKPPPPPPPQNPEEAQTKLALLRRDYAKQVKVLRKQYFHEVELQRLEQLLKEEARKLEMLRASEERNKSKAAAARVRAAKHKQFQEEFRQTLMKEIEEKLNYWRSREKAIQERKKTEKEKIHRQSSLWIDEKELEKKICGSVDASSPL